MQLQAQHTSGQLTMSTELNHTTGVLEEGGRLLQLSPLLTPSKRPQGADKDLLRDSSLSTLRKYHELLMVSSHISEKQHVNGTRQMEARTTKWLRHHNSHHLTSSSHLCSKNFLRAAQHSFICKNSEVTKGLLPIPVLTTDPHGIQLAPLTYFRIVFQENPLDFCPKSSLTHSSKCLHPYWVRQSQG